MCLSAMQRHIADLSVKKCPACGGNGVVFTFFPPYFEARCQKCGGTGTLNESSA